MSFLITTFYRFVDLPNYYDMQSLLKKFCVDNEIKGTILLAEEGINATISGQENSINNFFTFLDLDYRLKGMNYQISTANEQPFAKMKVRLKQEIVRLGVQELNNNIVGEYVSSENWDELISDPEVYVIDTRNDYEIKLGSFKNSINPKTQCFREFPQWLRSSSLYNEVDKKNVKVAMYCTGGVRCEKSTSFMKSVGFKNVYHLKGGILNYLKQTGNKNNMWQGECFIFDDRIAVGCDLLPSSVKCVVCSNYVTCEDLKSVSKGQVFCKNCRNMKVT